jgi:hypothetical protein
LGQQLAAAGLAPAALRREQIRDRHALRLPGAPEHQLRDVRRARGDFALELRTGDAHLVGSFERAHVLALGALLARGFAFRRCEAGTGLLLLVIARICALRVGRGNRRCRVHV